MQNWRQFEPPGWGSLGADPPTDIGDLKRGLRRNFARRAGTYDRHAQVQRFMADELWARTLTVTRAPRRLLEIGCGTGYLTALLRRHHPEALIVAVDLDRVLLQMARRRLGMDPRTALVMADGEAWCRGRFDLIIANATFQWFATPAEALANLRQSLASDGLLAFSTLGPGTFQQLAQSLAAAALRLGREPLQIPASRFLGQEDWLTLLTAAGYRDITLETASVTVNYPGVSQFLESLKSTGATNPRPQPLSPRLYLALRQTYQETFGVKDGIPATYDIIWATARR